MARRRKKANWKDVLHLVARSVLSLALVAGFVFFGLRWVGRAPEAVVVPESRGGGVTLSLPNVKATGPLIVVDPGHGGEDGGTGGNGLQEKVIALQVGLEFAQELQVRGHRVAMTRDSDATVALEDRSAWANTMGAECFVSVHFNHADSAAVQGLETYYSGTKELGPAKALAEKMGVPAGDPAVEAASVSLANAIHAAALVAVKSKDREVRNSGLSVTRKTACAAVLVECGYVSNAAEAGRIETVEWRKKLAAGLADGVEAWLKEREEARSGLPSQ